MEFWKPMDGEYQMYEISSNENVRNIKTKQILKTRKDYNGCKKVFLQDKNNLKKWVKVNDLVAYYIYNHIPF